MRIIFLLLSVLLLISIVSTQTTGSNGSASQGSASTDGSNGSASQGSASNGSASQGSASNGSGSVVDNTPCKINFRKNPQGVCVPVETCCKDDTCKPLYIANPTYKTKVKKIVIPYAIFRRYPYSELKECPKGFKKINDRQCINVIKTAGECPASYFRVNRKTCLKLVNIVVERTDYLKVKCGKNGEKDEKGLCKTETKKIDIDDIQESNEEIHCPKGYRKVGKFRCVKVLLCPKGYKRTQHGCKRIKIQCPPGYKRIFNTCTKVLKCKKGFIRVKGKCIKVSVKSCKNRKCPRVQCTRGFYKRRFKHTCCPRCVACKCSKFFDPVCATNGVTFRNKCDATCQGFKIKHRGTCNKPCSGRCPAFIKPVCGKDGKTYRNRCVLRSNLVDFAYNGKCRSKIVKDPKDVQKKIQKKVDKDLKKYKQAQKTKEL